MALNAYGKKLRSKGPIQNRSLKYHGELWSMQILKKICLILFSLRMMHCNIKGNVNNTRNKYRIMSTVCCFQA